MENESKLLLQEQYKKLPIELQQLLQSSRLHEQVTGVGQHNQLHIDQMGKLEDEIVMLMMGFTETDDFVEKLKEALNIELVKAEDIAIDIGKEIMLPLREQMKKAAEAAEKLQKKPLPLAEVHPADMMLSQKTVSTAPAPEPTPTPGVSQIPAAPATNTPPTATTPPQPKADPSAPKPYKEDPYREPIQ